MSLPAGFFGSSIKLIIQPAPCPQLHFSPQGHAVILPVAVRVVGSVRQQQAFVDPRVVEPDGGRREPGVLFVDRGPGRVAAVLLAAHQVGDLLAELLPRGAVQAEVD